MCGLFPKKDATTFFARALHQLERSVYPTWLEWMGPLVEKVAELHYSACTGQGWFNMPDMTWTPFGERKRG